MKKFNTDILVREYMKHGNCREVAEMYHCSDETVRRALIKCNVPRIVHVDKPPKQKRKPDEEEIESILHEYYSTDKTIIDVAKAFHRSQNTISDIIKNHGHGIKYNSQNATKIDDDTLIREVKVLTRQQIADKYGMHIASVDRRINRLKISAVKAEPIRTGIQYQGTWHYTDSGKDFVEKYQPNFEFIAYKQKRYKIKCKVCGHIVERGSSTIRKNICKCDKCQEQKQYEIELQKERVKLMRLFYAIEEQKKPKTCIVCGKEFHSQYAEKKYCSDKCKKSGNHIRNRCKKYGVYYDPEVTPIKIFERDHYRCMICGLFCNTEDDTWNGHFGAMSPTVDHIIALANGGTHTWDNVQCAHAICNSYKRDITL